MHIAIAIMLSLSCVACGGSVEYRASNAAVDADPLCVSRPDRPGEPTSRDCERSHEASWRSETRREPIDFRKDDDE
jgi:hypothetical protein